MTFVSLPVVDFGDSIGRIDKDAWFENILEHCSDMEADDTLKVYEFGENQDMLLEIIKDKDYQADPEYDENYVRIFVSQMRDGILEEVYDSDDIYVSGSILLPELQNIWEGTDMI